MNCKHRYTDKYIDAQIYTQIKFTDRQNREEKAFIVEKNLTDTVERMTELENLHLEKKS